VRPAHHSGGRGVDSDSPHRAISHARPAAGDGIERLRGASAQTVESAVTIPLEQQINGAQGMKYLSSSSGNDGSSVITATFDLDRDPDLAAVDIENRVNTAQGRLPSAVKTNGITVTKASNNFVLGAAIFSPNDRYSPLFMSNYADVT
jgi:HAE1 family hydrophobic/amphiphilic exporter-1